jgi:GT2 family glycosyltransferase
VPAGLDGAKPAFSPGDEGVRTIYAPQGSCLVFSRRYFEQGGSLEYPAFLFGEEIFVAETVLRLGLQVVYDPRLRVWHDEHASTGRLRSRKLARYVGQSAAYLADTFFP